MKTITIYTNGACANSGAGVSSWIILDGTEVLESEVISNKCEEGEKTGTNLLSCEYEAVASALKSVKKFADENTEIKLFFADERLDFNPDAVIEDERFKGFKNRIKDECKRFARLEFGCASKDDPYLNSCGWLCSQALALLEAKPTVESFQNIVCKPIGFVLSPFMKKEDCPKQGKFTEELSKINIFEEYKDGLCGLCEGDKVFVMCWFHESERNILKVKPHGHKEGDMRGVFSTRAPVRPNPISLTLVTIVSIQDCVLTVKGLEALCGTPVLDIKPYYPDTDT